MNVLDVRLRGCVATDAVRCARGVRRTGRAARRRRACCARSLCASHGRFISPLSLRVSSQLARRSSAILIFTVTAEPRSLLCALTPGRRPFPTLLNFYISLIWRFNTGSPSDGTHWLPIKEMTKLWEVSDETSTDRFPHFQCLTLQCDTSTLNLRLGGRLGFWSDLEVDLGGRGRGRRVGGVFPETTLDFLDLLQTRPDPTRRYLQCRFVRVRFDAVASGGCWGLLSAVHCCHAVSA